MYGAAPIIPDLYNININTSRRNNLMNSLQSPEAIAGIAYGGLGLAGGILGNRAQAGQNEKDRQLRREELMASMYGDQLGDLRQRQQGYMNTFAMDPVSQQRDLFSANLLRDIAGGGAPVVTPGQGVSNPVQVSQGTMGFLSPEALAENASRFYGAAGQLNPSALRPDLGAMGFGEAGAARQAGMDQSITQAGDRYNQLNQSRRDALMGQLSGGSGVASNTQYPGQRKGSGFWGKLGRVAGMAAPFAMMAVPGLQGPGLAAMLGRAGVSAGEGMLTSGRGGAAYGAVSSAANDYFNRRMGGR